jgi:excisionase family DNA binding protein
MPTTKTTDSRRAPAIQFSIEDHIFSVEDAATHLRISKSYLYELVAAGKLKLSKIGKRSIVTGRELARYVKSL